MIEQISGPGKTVLGTSVSRHVSGRAPIIFEYQRKDFITTNYATQGGFVQMDVATTSALFTVGDTVYFYASDGVDEISGTAKITAITVTSFTRLVLDMPYIAIAATTQYLNLNTYYDNYAFNLEVYGVRDDSSPIATQSLKPDKTGRLKFDVKPFVSKFPLKGDYVANVAQNDLLISIPFYLKVGDSYDITVNTPTRIDANDYYSTYFLPVIGSKFGQNQGYELAFPGASGDEEGEFLTDFEKPTFFEGWPFNLTFHYVPNGVIDNLSRVIKEFDHNGGALATTSGGFTVTELSEPIELQLIHNFASNTCLLKVSIEGSTTFSFFSRINPGIDGTFDPSINTSSGVANWLFEDLTTLAGNGISTSGNGLDGTNQVIRISNLDPLVITAIDFSNDKITGKLDATSLVNCTVYSLQDNDIGSFSGPSTTALVNNLNLSGNASIASIDLSGLVNLSGIVDLSDCNLSAGSLSIPTSSQIITSLDLSGNSLGYLNLARLSGLGGANGSSVNLADNNLTQSQVNSYIIDLNRIFTTGLTGRVIQIDGTNAAPSFLVPAVSAALASLYTKNVTVNYSGTPPPP
jgi:hypothetical protein